MMYTVDQMEIFYRIKLMGLIRSVNRVNKIYFETDIDSGSTVVFVDTGELIIKREVDFVSDTRAMEAFIQDAISQYIKK